jgi:hypothetical protein
MLIADAKIRRAYYSDKFCSGNPKDIMYTTPANYPVPIPRTLCLRKFSSANPKDTVLTQILQCQSQGHCAYYSDRSSSANSKDILYTAPANYPVPIPRTLCLRKFSSANHKGHCACVSDKFSSANPKDIVLTQTLQCQSQGHCVHTALTNSLVPIPRTLCTLLGQCLQCQS